MHGVIYSLSSVLPTNILILIYNTLIYTLIIQNIILWGGSPSVHINKIQIIMNKILRTIFHIRFDENHIPLVSTNEMYKSNKLMQFQEIYEYFLLRFIHFSFYQKIDIFNKFYLPLLPTHNYSTRNKRINLPNVRLELEKQSVLFQSCSLLNKLPEELLVPQSKTSLKRKFKSYLFLD